MKKRVAVVYGGYSSEHEISVKSGRYVASVLDKKLFDLYQVHIKKDAWLVNDKYKIDNSDFSFIEGGKRKKFDIVLILIHGTPGEDGILASYFQLIGLPFVSCSPLALFLTFNKYYCNHYLHDLGISIAKSIIIRKNEKVDNEQIVKKLGLPLFVKPNAGGSSFGTTKVKRVEDIPVAITNAREESEEVIIESFISGKEITVGVVRHKGKIIALTPCEIRSKREFFDYDAKYNPQLNEEIIPAQIEEKKLLQAKDLSVKIYKYLNCTGIVRIDYILGDDGDFYFLELNSIPGMTEASIVPKMLRYDNINITQLYTDLINETLNK